VNEHRLDERMDLRAAEIKRIMKKADEAKERSVEKPSYADLLKYNNCEIGLFIQENGFIDKSNSLQFPVEEYFEQLIQK
jgi:hypothetical protein